MNALISERRFAEAVDIADTIDWKRVKNVNMLCKVSDLYKINRRLEECRDLLLLAYDRYPSGRAIVYSLCEIELRLNEYVRALQYYNEFVALAPRDAGRYILQYKLYEAQDVGVEERIGVLEELKKHDYRERWAYTLAELYRQAGQTSRCAQECDELVAAFGGGRFVVKALELKKKIAKLTPAQEEKLRALTAEPAVQETQAQPAYESQTEQQGQSAYEAQPEPQAGQSYSAHEANSEAQAAYGQSSAYEADSEQEQPVYETQTGQSRSVYGTNPETRAAYGQPSAYEADSEQEQPVYEPQTGRPYSAYETEPEAQTAYEQPQSAYETQSAAADGAQMQDAQPAEDEIRVRPIEESQFNTVNLQKTIAAGLQEVMQPSGEGAGAQGVISHAASADAQKAAVYAAEADAQGAVSYAESTDAQGVTAYAAAAGAQGAVSYAEPTDAQGVTAYAAAAGAQDAVSHAEPTDAQGVPTYTAADTAQGTAPQASASQAQPASSSSSEAASDGARTHIWLGGEAQSADGEPFAEEALWRQTPEQLVNSAYDAVLAQETDGQYSMALEEEPLPEKQITGQLDFAGIMAEWERIRRDNEQKRAKENRQRVLQNTGPILERFNETSKQGVLEDMEKELEAEARRQRQAAVRPSGASLSDGLTREERQRAALAAGRDEQDAWSRESGRGEANGGSAVNGRREQSGFDGKAEGSREQRGVGGAENRRAQNGVGAASAVADDAASRSARAAFEAARTARQAVRAADSPDAERTKTWNPAEVSRVADIQAAAVAAQEKTEAAEAAKESGAPVKEGDTSYRKSIKEDAASAAGSDDFSEADSYETSPSNDEAGYRQRAKEDDAAYDSPEEQSVAAEEDEYLRQERGTSRRDRADREENRADREDREDRESGERRGDSYREKRARRGDFYAEDGEDRGDEPYEDEVGEENEDAGEDQPIDETQELPEFVRQEYGDPDKMTKRQKEALRREVDENRSQRRGTSDEDRVRAMTRQERALFGPYLSAKHSRRQILQAIDSISLAACTGNVIVTGEEGAGTLNLAKGLIREIQLTDQNFSGKVARTTGEILNRRELAPIIDKLKNGALIVEHAAALSDESAASLRRELEREERGLIVLLIDTKKTIDRFFAEHEALSGNFTARVDVKPLDNDTLVRYAKAYAKSQDYSIDEFGVLALHTRIASMQTSEHSVTLGEVRDIVDDAIYYADKKTPAHFMDVILRRRYDEDDRIILKEKDFSHY